MSVSETKSRRYELVAPDGGWGYIICLGVILNLATLMGFINCFGMLYKDLFIEIDMDSTSVTLFNGVCSFCVAVAGFVTNPLLKFMSIRKLGLLAAFVFTIGTFGAIFAKSKLQFFIFQGVFQGLGNGITFNVSCTILNNYFVKRRLLAFSFTQTISAVACLLSPYFVKWSLETYGYQGTLLLVCGLSMHSIVGMSVMQPVEWHMKKVEVLEPTETETKLLLSDDKQYETNKQSSSAYELDKSEHIINKPTHDVQHMTIDNKKEHINPIKLFFSQFIDFSLIKPFLLSNACLGVSFSAFLDFISMMLLPQALYAMDWNEGEVARVLSLSAFGDLITRIVFIFMNNMLLKLGSHEVYVAGLVIAAVSRLGMVWTSSKTASVAFITMMGISRCTIVVLIPVVVADTISQDKFTSAMGLILLLFGTFNWCLGPVIGAIRDWTNSYTVVFYILASCHSLVVISWTIELLWKRTKHNKKTKMGASFQS